MPYAVLQINSAIYGTGSTVESAVRDAKQWLDSEEMVNSFTPLHEANDGDLVCIECTLELANAVEVAGGDIAYDITNGVAHLPID